MMYKVDQSKLEAGMHELMKGAINRLEETANIRFSDGTFVEGYGEYMDAYRGYKSRKKVASGIIDVGLYEVMAQELIKSANLKDPQPIGVKND